jgi:hypothetical protein
MKPIKGKTMTQAAHLWGVSTQRVQQILQEHEVMVVRWGRNNRFLLIPEKEFQRVSNAREINAQFGAACEGRR